jgi:hypothetical protein
MPATSSRKWRCGPEYAEKYENIVVLGVPTRGEFILFLEAFSP